VLIDAPRPDNETPNSRPELIYEAVLSRLPVPSEITPWEDIIEFRHHRASADRFLALRRWIDKTVRSDLPVNEVRDELDYLINEFEAHMRVARMEFRYASLRSLFSVPLEAGKAALASDWTSIDWRKILSVPFEIKQHRITLA
jgi:hypothetical protein